MRLPLSRSAAPRRWIALVAVVCTTLVGGAVGSDALGLPQAKPITAAAVPAPVVPAPVALPEAASDIPPEVLATYRAAALRHDLPWTVLAAIGKAATDHGRRSPDDALVRTAVWPEPAPAITGPGGVGPLLLDPAQVPEVADPALLQRWPVAVEVVAARLDAALDAVATRAGVPRAALAAQRDLAVTAPSWTEAVRALPVAATGGACEARPQEPAGGALVRALWTCALGAAEVQVAMPTTTLTGADARTQLTAEAMDLAWRWSRWGTAPCDPRAALAGVFPVPRAARIDRCDPAANVAWVASSVTAAEQVPLEQRTSTAGGWAALAQALAGATPLPDGRATPEAMVPDADPMPAWPTWDNRFERRVLEHAARYSGGTVPVDVDVVGAMQAIGETRAAAWKALATWRALELQQPTCTIGVGPVLTLALPDPVAPPGWEAYAHDGSGDGVVDPADRDDRIAGLASGLCAASAGWAPEAQLPVAVALTGDTAPGPGTPATLALDRAAAVDLATAALLDAAVLPDPAIGPAIAPLPRPQLPSRTPAGSAASAADAASEAGAAPGADVAGTEAYQVEAARSTEPSSAAPATAAPTTGAASGSGPGATTTAPPRSSTTTTPSTTSTSDPAAGTTSTTSTTAPPATDPPPPPSPEEAATTTTAPAASSTTPVPTVDPVTPEAPDHPDAGDFDADAVQDALRLVSGVQPGVAIVTVRGIRVAATVAPSLEAMLAAAEADGVVLTGGGYRTTASQVLLRAAHCGTTSYDLWEKPSGECAPDTATPGASLHETGEAVDFVRCEARTTACYRWLARNAAGYGFFNQPTEAWHWSIDGR